MNLQQHIHNLHHLCRLCGERVQTSHARDKNYKPKICSSYAGKIQQTFMVDVKNDEATQHPKHICHTCYTKLYHDKVCASVTWDPHPRTGPCIICERWQRQGRGGRPKKRKFHKPQKRNTPAMEAAVVVLPVLPAASPGTKVKDILDRPLDAPITPEMEQVAAHIVKTKMRQSGDGIASFKTGGQPLNFIHLPKPRKKTSGTEAVTKRRRSDVMTKARNYISKGDPSAQLSEELKQVTMDDLHLSKIVIPKGEFLALKADTCSSWKKARELKRWLKQRGIETECEAAMRKQQSAILGDQLKAEWLPLLHKDQDDCTILKRTPWVGAKSLLGKLTQQLDGLHRLDLLTWHNATVPPEEIWVKIGGDKGGGTFKQVFQIANVCRPNAQRNTVVVVLFPADDVTGNLKIALQQHGVEVSELQTCQWKNKALRVFIFGDYEYLCRIYGITGASGRHSCLWCTCTKEEMRTPQAQRESQPRDLTSMERDLAKFMDDGGRLPHAKFYNNVISQPLFNVPIDQVCPPGLHISLGLYLKHFNAFERECHLIDKQVSMLATTPQQDFSPAFKSASAQYRKALQLEEEAAGLGDSASILMEHLPTVADEHHARIYQTAISQHLEEKNKLMREADHLRSSASFEVGDGPIARQLDDTLQKFRVCRQAYHGKSFVGNHVHRCSREENVDMLTGSMVDTVKRICPQLQEQALATAKKHNTLFRLFGVCHRQYNTAEMVTKEQIDALDDTIKAYLSFFRSNFPDETVPPKMHLLEDHVVPFMRRWGVGLGFLGEQGVESVHARLNEIKVNVRGLPDELQVLRSVMVTHWVQTRPGAK